MLYTEIMFLFFAFSWFQNIETNAEMRCNYFAQIIEYKSQFVPFERNYHSAICN